tara:strand:+ start:1081 stop:1455 length:375 start_codon:yes stop_codon:yes gene_type:complete
MDRYDKLITAFKAHMADNPLVECCGLITKTFEYIPCDNISFDPKNSFIIDPIKIYEYADNCWGFFHSHTIHHDELPSETDKNSAIFKEYKFIMGNHSNKFYIYWLGSLDTLKFAEFNEGHINAD